MKNHKKLYQFIAGAILATCLAQTPSSAAVQLTIDITINKLNNVSLQTPEKYTTTFIVNENLGVPTNYGSSLAEWLYNSTTQTYIWENVTIVGPGAASNWVKIPAEEDDPADILATYNGDSVSLLAGRLDGDTGLFIDSIAIADIAMNIYGVSAMLNEYQGEDTRVENLFKNGTYTPSSNSYVNISMVGNDVLSGTVDKITVVPEPSHTAAALALAGIIIALYHRKRRGLRQAPSIL